MALSVKMSLIRLSSSTQAYLELDYIVYRDVLAAMLAVMARAQLKALVMLFDFGLMVGTHRLTTL